MAEERRPGARSNQSRIPESLQNISTSPDGTPSTQVRPKDGKGGVESGTRKRLKWNKRSITWLAVSPGSCRLPRLSAGKPRVRAPTIEVAGGAGEQGAGCMLLRAQVKQCGKDCGEGGSNDRFGIGPYVLQRLTIVAAIRGEREL
jgi:hypothetical protein